MQKKMMGILMMVVFLFTMSGIVKATNEKTKLEIVQTASETKQLENEQGSISKTIVDSNPEAGEVTVELKLSNTKKDTETASTGAEIFLVVDNSPSMDFVTSTGETRKEIILESATELVESIFATSSDVKVGLIDFHGRGLFEFVGLHNAIVRQELTTNKSEVLTAIQEQLARNTSSGTNIEAGLLRAESEFSKDCTNRIVILLTDGIPNNTVTRSLDAANEVNTEEAKEIQEITKQAILDLKEEGIYVITMLTGMSESDGNTDKDGTVYDTDATVEEELAAAERIFGTQSNPTADRYYLVKNTDVNTVITKDILQDVTDKIQNPINNVKIVDYFPEDITNNFTFSYVGEPSVGTISEEIDSETKTITWDIGTLKGDESATVRYKLKLNNMNNTSLLNKTIATNERVVLTYQDVEDENYTVTLSSSPQIQLVEEQKEEITINNGNNNINNNVNNNPSSNSNTPTSITGNLDNTKATGVLPQTGVSATAIVVGGILGCIVLLGYRKYQQYRDIK